MGPNLQRTPQLRFALVSLAVVAVAAGAYAFIGGRAAASRERDAVARSAATLIAEPYRSLFESADTTVVAAEPLKGSADSLAFTLGAGALRGVRVTAAGGLVMYEGGARLPDLPRPPRPGGIASTSARGGDGAKLFVTQLGANGYAVEVAQDAGPIDAAASSALSRTIVTVVATAVGAWILLQSAFWFAIRSLTRKHGELSHLYDTGEQLRSSMDLHDVLTQLAQDATRLGGGQFGLVALFDEATSEVMLRATYDRATGSVSLHQRAIDEWFIRRCIATNTAIVSTLPEGGARQYFGADAVVSREAPLFCAPMTLGERVVGAIAVVGSISGRGSFSPADVRLIEQLAGQAVTAVEQSLLFAKVRADATEIEASYDSTLKALMAALDAKDEVTEGHCERVARVTLQLCKQMGVPESMLIHIERGAMLHDVGKIGVPDSVLKKPAKLSEAEWETMRKHPMLAGLMVSKIGFLEPALPILLYHHEKFDGTGYPFGLAGGNIPLEARIFTIVDAYDAMTQDRPYRAAMSHLDAMEEIRAHNGTQFDPQVVAGFEQLMASRPDLRGGATTHRRVLGIQDLPGHDEEHVA